LLVYMHAVQQGWTNKGRLMLENTTLASWWDS